RSGSRNIRCCISALHRGAGVAHDSDRGPRDLAGPIAKEERRCRGTREMNDFFLPAPPSGEIAAGENFAKSCGNDQTVRALPVSKVRTDPTLSRSSEAQ